MSETVLEMKGISKAFSGVGVLEEIHLQVAKGEVHALMGENGAGKSTLMKILLGIHPADRGEILLEGRRIVNRSPREAMDKGIAMIHQELHPVLDMTVWENVFLGREIRTRFGLADKKAMARECGRLFTQLDVPVDPGARMRDLGVAQCQLVEIVKAVSLSAKVVVMDEPTSAITDREVEILFQQIARLKAQGVGVIYISHKMEEIFRIADRITVLRDGRHMGTDSAADLDNDRLIRRMVGREIREVFPKETVVPGEVVLEVRGLCWGRKVRDVDLSLRKGEILGIAGLVGAGRSELAQTLFGIHKPTGGSVHVHGKPVRIQRPGDAIALKMALVTEDRKGSGLNLKGTVQENITLASLDRLFPRGILDGSREGDVVSKSMEKLKVKAASPKAPVDSLSGGNQQKVVLAKWLLAGPEIIVLDEPTRGVDVGAKRDIYLLLGELVKAGKAVIVISSEIPEIMGIADRILVMAAGRVTGEVARKDFNQERILGYAAQFEGGGSSGTG
ncbi:sugar ABC transporter ATP-binding protein [Clostridiales bacterium F-3ap]|uniref:Sugar ABC transporter ATP-binding protein n=1 Tax=Anaerotalea alkaliphila TaxID=2662126 RepID=A0A7X5HXX6_9FIRM|nr:sugar ABC transporter ATP-binding protein [Anaerotalea alkaliphila]